MQLITLIGYGSAKAAITFAIFLILLTSVGSKSAGTKIAIIKLSPKTALAIENRRQTELDKLRPDQEGVIVYRIDTAKVSGTGAIKPLSNLSKVIPDKAGNLAPLSTLTQRN